MDNIHSFVSAQATGVVLRPAPRYISKQNILQLVPVAILVTIYFLYINIGPDACFFTQKTFEIRPCFYKNYKNITSLSKSLIAKMRKACDIKDVF